MASILISLLALYLAAAPAQQSVLLYGSVEDENRQPVAGVQVTLHSATRTEQASTNELGQFRFEAIPPGDYRLDFNKAGFFRVGDYAVTTGTAPTEITIVLNHEYEIRSTVDVVATTSEIEPQQTQHGEELVAEAIREDPVPSSHSLQ